MQRIGAHQTASRGQPGKLADLQLLHHEMNEDRGKVWERRHRDRDC